ncbi:MAG: ABC transporter permease [Proteobacteria bacterium]|nr:ABC transporter permease [Pseudomonadota bacterium]
MNSEPPGFELVFDADGNASLLLTGDWVEGQKPAAFAILRSDLYSSSTHQLVLDSSRLGSWDSTLMAFLLQCHNYCQDEDIDFQATDLPTGADKLLAVATAVRAHIPPQEPSKPWLSAFNPARLAKEAVDNLSESLGFIGEVAIALTKLVAGKSNTRMVDFKNFCYQAGPEAFGIISLTSILVGMILAYLGAVQLLQFGAEIYVADLVVIGTLREMGALMTAIVMAGRTGAAYAAQLGTMQTNEEIDAITTMGISPIEFLVVPRMLALVAMMPLLTIYADLLGIVGGGIVAGGMGITPLQYINQGETALQFSHFFIGLIKSVIFAVLIAVAGCRSGINSGRSSAAVGQAATEAVVTAIVYLIIADAAINILFQQIGI